MPRVSSVAKADLAAVPVVNKRQEPPDELTPVEASIWRAIIAARPAGWFTAEMEPVMRNLCAVIATSRIVERQLREINEKSLKDPVEHMRFVKLTKLHMTQSKVIASISTRLRLTPQSRHDRNTTGSAAKRAAKEAKQPWDAAA